MGKKSHFKCLFTENTNLNIIMCTYTNTIMCTNNNKEFQRFNLTLSNTIFLFDSRMVRSHIPCLPNGSSQAINASEGVDATHAHVSPPFP